VEASYLDGLLVRLLGKVEHREHLLLLGEGHGQVEERVKGDGHLRKRGSYYSLLIVCITSF